MGRGPAFRQATCPKGHCPAAFCCACPSFGTALFTASCLATARVIRSVAQPELRSPVDAAVAPFPATSLVASLAVRLRPSPAAGGPFRPCRPWRVGGLDRPPRGCIPRGELTRCILGMDIPYHRQSRTPFHPGHDPAPLRAGRHGADRARARRDPDVACAAGRRVNRAHREAEIAWMRDWLAAVRLLTRVSPRPAGHEAAPPAFAAPRPRRCGGGPAPAHPSAAFSRKAACCAQVISPRSMPHVRGPAGGTGRAGPLAHRHWPRPADSDLRPAPPRRESRLATRWVSITPPMAARIEGCISPPIHGPAARIEDRFHSSTTKDTSPPTPGTPPRSSASAPRSRRECSMFFELMKISKGRRLAVHVSHRLSVM